MSNISEKSEWSIVIKPKAKFFDINLKEIFHYWDLITLFVKRDFVAYYQQTLIGPLWYIIQPLVSTIVFSVIFGTIAKIPTDGIPGPLFYLAGITIWNYFSTCLTSTSDVFGSNAGIFGKVYFPRLCVPISTIISNFIKFIIQFLLFFGFLIYFILMKSNINPNIFLLMVPLLLIQVAFLGFGFGILISSLTTKYRDLKFVVSFGIQLWMYATPIVYPISQVPKKWLWVIILNPMSYIVELFKYAFIGVGTLHWDYYFVSIAFTILILFLGLLIFNKVEKTFMDRV
jgi:lipopolysaccharide transport system permease protein